MITDSSKLDALEVFDNATSELGNDLSGFSLIDLLADNLPLSLDECAALAHLVCEQRTVSARLADTYRIT